MNPPLPLPTNALVQISAKGIADYRYLQGRDFLGPISLSNSNGTVQVAGVLGGVRDRGVKRVAHRAVALEVQPGWPGQPDLWVGARAIARIPTHGP